jgi:hypothetical protein
MKLIDCKDMNNINRGKSLGVWIKVGTHVIDQVYKQLDEQVSNRVWNQLWERVWILVWIRVGNHVNNDGERIQVNGSVQKEVNNEVN